MIGGNASAEGGEDDGAEDTATTGCNIVIANRLQAATTFDKKGFQTYIKVFVCMKQVSVKISCKTLHIIITITLNFRLDHWMYMINPHHQHK